MRVESALDPGRGRRGDGRHYGIAVFAIRGIDADGYYRHLDAAIDTKPNFYIDDGADVIGLMHSTRDDALADMIGRPEETTTGVIRLRAPWPRGGSRSR